MNTTDMKLEGSPLRVSFPFFNGSQAAPGQKPAVLACEFFGILFLSFGGRGPFLLNYHGEVLLFELIDVDVVIRGVLFGKGSQKQIRFGFVCYVFDGCSTWFADLAVVENELLSFFLPPGLPVVGGALGVVRCVVHPQYRHCCPCWLGPGCPRTILLTCRFVRADLYRRGWPGTHWLWLPGHPFSAGLRQCQRDTLVNFICCPPFDAVRTARYHRCGSSQLHPGCRYEQLHRTQLWSRHPWSQ